MNTNLLNPFAEPIVFVTSDVDENNQYRTNGNKHEFERLTQPIRRGDLAYGLVFLTDVVEQQLHL